MFFLYNGATVWGRAKIRAAAVFCLFFFLTVPFVNHFLELLCELNLMPKHFIPGNFG